VFDECVEHTPRGSEIEGWPHKSVGVDALDACTRWM
jgi:hypothetical protein